MSEDETTVLRLVLHALDDIKTSMRQMQERLDNLGDKFVPRGEFQVRMESSVTDRADLREQLRRTNERIDDVEDNRRTAHRFTISTLLTSVGLLVALLTIIIAHWK